MAQKPSIPKGTRDFSPLEMMRRQYIFDKIRDVFRTFGFGPLETPAMENLSTLLGKYGDEGDKLLFKILNSGDYAAGLNDEELRTASRICEKGLRYDLTVPFARYVVQHQSEIAFPFKRYQIQPVWRADRPQKGRYREFYQCDVDVIGSRSLINEVELIEIVEKVFAKLGIAVTLKMNNRKILYGIAETIGHADKMIDITVAIDKLEKIGAEKVKTILVEDFGVEAATADELLKFIETPGGTEGILAALESYKGKNEVFDLGAEELKTVATYMQAFGVPADHFEIDLTIARGLDYYTGTVYETAMLDHPEIGSICSGGRYDNLAEYYTDKQLPGVGISIGLTRLFYVLGEQGYLNDHMNKAPADVLILPMTDDMGAAIKTATALRESGIRTQLYSEQKKFKHKIGYADKLGIPFVIFLGEDEINAGVVAVKDMESGEQVKVSLDEAAKLIHDGLAKKNAGKVICDK